MSIISGGTTRISKVGLEMNFLAVEMKGWLSDYRTVRLELGRNGGHKRSIKKKLLEWLDEVDSIEIQFKNVFQRYLSLGLVEFTRFRPSAVLIFLDSSRLYNKGVSFRSFLVEVLRDEILNYLHDPTIKTVFFYGEGRVKRDVANHFTTEESSYKIVRIELLHKSKLKNLQHHIASQLQNQDAETNKCLFLFDIVDDDDDDNGDGVPISGYKVKCTFPFIYRSYLFFEIEKQIVNLRRRVFLLEPRFFNFRQWLPDEKRVPGKFTTPQPLTGKLAQQVSGNIWEYLFDPLIEIIGLYGVGGVGKTTIIKNICSELANTDPPMFDIIIWVSPSRTPMNPDNYMRLQDEIAMQLGIKLMGYQGPLNRAERISEKVKTIEKCLLILDDVWEPVDLRLIGFDNPYNFKARKMVITTRNQDVCTRMAVDKKINLAPMSDKEAWDLFVSNSGDHVLDPEINTIAKELVCECGGLPITIITLCHVMKDEVNVDAWRLALLDIQSSHSKIYGEGMDHLFDVLLLGYKHLLNDQTRMCFLCCAIFPDDHKFVSTELIRYWMAMNVICNEGGIVESIGHGQKILKELKDVGMFEIFMESGIEWLKMHDLFRDLAVIIVRVEHDFVVEAGVGLTQFEGTRNGNISLIRNRIYSLFGDIPCVNLSTLFLRDNPLGSIPDSFFLSVPNLQVLDMSYSEVNQLPSSFSELHKLRVLFLDFCMLLAKFPSFKNLKDLQFLSLRGTLIKELPYGIDGLVNLKSLDLSETIRLKHIEAGVISSLSNLEELQLQGSLLCKMESPEVAHLFTEIRCLKQLGVLTLSTVGFGDPLDTILHLQQFNLKIFSVNAYGSTLDYIEDEHHN